MAEGIDLGMLRGRYRLHLGASGTPRYRRVVKLDRLTFNLWCQAALHPFNIGFAPSLPGSLRPGFSLPERAPLSRPALSLSGCALLSSVGLIRRGERRILSF